MQHADTARPATGHPLMPRVFDPQGTWFENGISLAGRAIIAWFFIGAARYHLSSAHYADTLSDMTARGVPAPALGLAIGMAVSVIASLALVFRMGGRWPALVLAVYSIAVSWLMHNPIYGHGPDMFFFYKDLAITGALLLAGSWPGNSRL
ncbi:putative oxidoreductase [Novosphingobium capsulatum]|uniref:Oxidoreductase n=1 Tax=Novosphingobium capsulatum TaxID=13688 RepID=A0ABU1MLV5_9SPHN|nr:DoxX family membrane protein [Novosphingobium capsulatum]MDR6511338.1 putative oxidoreductase [Novosphingobium capsulatum]WQD91268.1 DoxX family membrane protein [Novosphingobium capsulatum]